VREVAGRFAQLLDAPEPRFVGEESEWSFLGDASRCRARYGPPRVSADTLVEWTASWVRDELPTLGKPTHFETQDGKY
jgi:hypothetical protein